MSSTRLSSTRRHFWSRHLWICGFLPATVIFLAMAAPAHAQQPGCMNEIVPLRQAVETHGKALQAAANRKAERTEICQRVRTYAAAEGKFIKYLEENQSWCGVPPDAIKQLKTNYGNTVKMRNQACAVAAAPVQRGPGLSEALGTVRTAPPPASGTGVGTYNTLTGNAFNR